MPSMGALFVSNPRRRRNRGRVGTRRLWNVSKNKLISKSAGMSLAQVKALKGCVKNYGDSSFSLDKAAVSVKR